ncbi:MAG: UTP--glucose-1-phosphate uridylyltransferase GalU [Halorhodospira halophila]|uniref:UTP--glucose-1-phosphate uridylyltransferase GalU n=1 Tax=Halorhodospira TaxID=85108 RepID=UPI001911DD01|nr:MULTISPECIES: UTP--glucose-1-phosphate uridylyltransferase GalU [Halorhodospira]MBK5936639.1 UTP--glucose-1-phosphate uridylyltransferase [Halorhodospira halophila]MBK5944503.1 UTP--glucose-1-phosphate uridylyltransferase [Halorhodospira halophila]MCC3750789.1 UTP--glucose-1-phosphate uridylyltransferase GalU [Halorhodospira halophila]MCG5527374.1 UTP--glucose-1-phosphate uridylyltransferase GalU [Halorhodospira halophila]MCG5532906.1 UTP--glucose-1-phosphate uridylyltransferase GalU [Halor
MSANYPIRTVVFPVAGLGTRFLPATKASPKEMLPVVDKPLIQYAVEEAVAAGAEYLVFVTGRTKRAIEDHFDTATELERELEAKGKEKLLQLVKDTVPKGVSCIYIRQGEALGLGHAVACARPAVGRREPFGVILADDLINAGDDAPALAQMAGVAAWRGGSVLGVERVPQAETDKYGVVEGETVGDGVTAVSAMVEKPSPAEAPSNLAVVGRYILSRNIFHHLDRTRPDHRGEIQLTDAIVSLMAEEPVYAYEYAGERYDCGSKFGYLQATVAYGLEHPELGPDFRDYVRGLGDDA